MTRLQARKEEEKVRHMEELEALRLIEEQHLANKKKNNEAQKQQDKEDKRKKDEEDALKHAEEVTAAAIIMAQEKETVTVNDEYDKKLNKNLHHIFSTGWSPS